MGWIICSRTTGQRSKAPLRAAWNLNVDKGIAPIKGWSGWRCEDAPRAATSRLECLEARLTIGPLDFAPPLHGHMATASIIESPHAGACIPARRVPLYPPGRTVLHWIASALLRAKKRVNRILGRQHLGDAILNLAATAGEKVVP